MSSLPRLVKEFQELEEFKKTAVCPTFDIFDICDEWWTVFIHGPIDSKFEGMIISFFLDFNKNYPFSAPTITCLETVEGTFFKKKEVITFDYLSTEPWSPAMRVLTILIAIQSYLASIKTFKEPVSEERIQEQINALREPDTQEPRNEQTSVKGRNSKAKKDRKAGPKAARKRPSISTTSEEPARKKISKNIQQALPESSQLGESHAVDEKIKAAKIKEMAQKVKEEYDASLKELDRALEEKLKTHEAELLDVQRKIQETLEKRKKLREDLQNL